MNLRQSMVWRIGLLAVVAAVGGCRTSREIRDPEYAAVLSRSSRAAASPDPAAEALAPADPALARTQPVDALVQWALAQNPDIQAARKRVDAMAQKVPQAASLKDPMLGITAYPAPVETAAGRQDVALAASQQVPWFGKLRTRAEVAEAEVNVARAQLAAVELETVEQVKRAYYELYFIQKAIDISERDRKLLVDLTGVAESRYRTGKVSQQDVLRAQVEVSNLDSQLIRLRQQLDSSQAKLARLLHVSPDTPLRALDRLPGEQVPRDLERLYRQAVEARPELHAQLAVLAKDRRAVELARLEYYPDVTAGVTWIATDSAGLSPVANGQDAVLLGFSMNLPVYRKRLDAGVREAEAQAVSSARRYDSLRDRTAEEVKDLYTQAVSQYELVRLFRDDIVPKAEQTLEVSRSAYGVGQVDFLQLVDNWRQLLRFQVTYRRLESQLQQTLASLERVVGGQLQVSAPGATAPQEEPEVPGPEPAAAPAVPVPPRS